MERYLEILRKFQAQLVEAWGKLSTRNRVIAASVAVLVPIAIGIFVWNMRSVAYRPLYTDLSEVDAGAATDRLRQLEVEYKLAKGGTTILVPESRLDELRLQLASEGLPEQGRLGFELFDKANFGATEFAEHVNFQRALEGELARTISSMEEVKAARVHLTLPKRSVFLDNQQPAKASVVLELSAGAELSNIQTKSITALVASAVEDLPPEAVVIVDTSGKFFYHKPAGEEEQIQYQRSIEREIVRKVIETLEPNVGPAGIRVNVVVECDWDGGEQTEEILDPETVLMTTQTSAETADARTPEGVPGTEANLPRDPADPDAEGRGVTRSVETHNYQTSKTTTHMRLERGAIKRMSVAVLLDYQQTVDEEARQIVRVPRPEEELKVLEDLAAAAAGVLPERGDTISVRSLPFTILEPPLTLPPATLDPSDQPLTPEWFRKHQLKFIAGFVGILLLVAATIWFRKRMRTKRAEAERQAALEAEREKQELLAAKADEKRQKLEEEERLLKGLKAPVDSTKGLVLKKHLEEMIDENPQAFAKLIQGWIAEDGA